VIDHDDDHLGRAYDHRLMRRLLGYLRPYRARVVAAVAVVIADAVIQLAGPWLTMRAIDHGIRERDLAYLDRIAILYFSVLIAGFVLGWLQTQIMQSVGQRVMLDLRMALFTHLQRLPIAYYDRNRVGRLLTRVTNDVDVLNELFTAGVVAIFGDMFTLVGILIAMSRINPELMGVAFSVIPLILLVTLVFRARVRTSFRDIRTRLARLNAFMNETLSGMTTVQLFGREPRNFDDFRTINAGHRDANLQTVFYHALFFPALELIGALAVSLIVWYGGRQVMWTSITLGTLVAFIQYTQRFFRPISDLSEKYNILQQAMASSERIFDLLDTPADPRAPAPTPAGNGIAAPAARRGAAARGGFEGRVEFDRVWFAYREPDWVLRDVSFTIAPGERLALVGATGSGKSTIASLLMGFYTPQRGVIRVDGRPLDAWDLGELRRHLGFVLQDVFLFSGTIAGNLRLGDATLATPAVEQAAREVHAHEFIERLPGAYDAPVVERGATFSAGQRQLLAFARVLACDPSLLVLDEATSSVDPRTEAQLQDALRRLMRGRSCLVIAHRLTTIQDVHRVVVIHRGEVRESGTHADLMALGGIYYRLYQLQFMDAARRSGHEVAGAARVADSQVVDSRLDLA
jgi:ATP-binding cassette, subfamily B, multidrug efflux pump